MRDTNRGRIYKAETAAEASLRKARGATAAAKRDRTFATAEEAQAFLDELRKQHENEQQLTELQLGIFVKDPTAKKQVTSTYYSLGNKACPGLVPSIGLHPTMMNGITVCHEYTHHLLRIIGDANNVFRGVPSHGSEFGRTMIEVLKGAYPDQPHIPATVEAAYEDRKVIMEPRAQRDAAHKQVLRLRSDVLLADKKAKVIPMSMVIWADDPDDYCGLTYRYSYQALDLASTRGNTIAFARNDERTFTWRQLRYIEAPMVRAR